MKKSEIHIRNKALKARLWKEGFYVQEVGQVGKPDYLIVSVMNPESTTPTTNECPKFKHN